jgi:arsenate reductase
VAQRKRVMYQRPVQEVTEHEFRGGKLSMKVKVLFLCTGNSARSQMAEGYLRHVAGDQFEPLSAGIEPKGLNPLALEAMAEIGIDISRQRSKDVTSLLGQAIPYVITVCDNAREHCPIFPRTYKFLHWSFDDPAAAVGSHEEKLAVFRQVRDQIIKRIDKELIARQAEIA